VALAGAVFGLTISAALAQSSPPYGPAPRDPCAPCPWPAPQGLPGSSWTMPVPPGAAPAQPGVTGEPPTAAQPQPAPSTDQFGALTQGADIGGGTAVARGDGGGYLDSAIPRTQLRFRFDAAYGDNRPDRAEFFYAKCGCFRTPDSRGPPLTESKVDYQEISSYAEVAFDNRFSAFLEVPVRFMNFEVNQDTNGLSDINFGAKYAFVADPNHYVTAELRTYTPTGDPFKGLGTNHWTLEPGLLTYCTLSDRLWLQTEVRDFIPLGGSDFAGNVLRTGVGVTYGAYSSPSCRVSPVVELVNWTVLSGKESNEHGQIKHAAGDDILNAKFGVRFGLGDGTQPGLLNQSDFYVGYGRALTGAVWYKDMIRAELRLRY
jgi:hypothetical protein